MMVSFYHINPVLQAALLVISQFAVIFLASGTILLYKRGRRKLFFSSAILAINVMLYVLMQLDSNLTGTGRGLLSRVPYALLLLVTLLSIGFFSHILYDAIKNRRIIDKRSIKEAFDNLPAGVCFFNDSGLPVLCNHAMQRFSFAVCGKDVQFIDDLEVCLSDGFVPVSEVTRDGNIFVLSDGSAKRLEKRSFIHENGERFTEFVVTDVTELHERQVELEGENAQQRRVQADLKRLSANIVTATREEEILNTKMRVHDEMGRCLVAAQKYLSGDGEGMLP